MSGGSLRRLIGGIAIFFFGFASRANAESVDRVVVRFVAPEIGGVRAPRFIFARELAFEARLEALTDSEFARHSERPYLERHVQSALERSVAETLLASLRVEPSPTEEDVSNQADLARRILLDRIGGEDVLKSAGRAEGIGEGDMIAIFRRRARAGIYLDRMVAPMLAPTPAELRQVYATEPHPYSSMTFDQAQLALGRWVVGRRLRDAFDLYFQNARQRLEVTVIAP